MHHLVQFMILAVTLATYLATLHLIPAAFKFIPEALSCVVALYVVVAGIRSRFELVRTQYWIFFGGAAIVILCGIAANAVSPGPIIAGARIYLRAIPFFFLAAVYTFTERQIKQQLGLLTAIALLQIPISAYQKYSLLREGRFTGDYVFGTLMLSPTVTIFLVAGICIVLALALRQRISKPIAAVLFVLFLIPTTINETKVTIFILPVSVLLTMMIATEAGKRLRMLGVSLMLMVVAGAIFIPIFNWVGKQNVSDKEAQDFTDMFTKKDYFKKYLDQETRVGDTKAEIGRVDGFTVPASILAKDPVLFAFGLGLGNASISSLGTEFSGEHSVTLGRYSTGAPSAGAMLLEIGWLGFVCAYALHWLIFRDSLILARRSTDLIGTIAIGWPAIVLMYSMTFFYTPMITFESLSYLFWYLSGLIAASRMKLLVKKRGLRS